MPNERDFLLRTGMINKAVFAGIQPDDCVVWRKTLGGSQEFQQFEEFSLCNHNCVMEGKDGKPTGGNYVCDASLQFAEGVVPGFASRDKIVVWTKIVAVALGLARDEFFGTRLFDRYCEEFRVPPSWANAIRGELTALDKKVECNRFGGSPSMLPECAGIIADSKKANLVVNLTDPGRRLMKDKQFVKEITTKDGDSWPNLPNILAMSFDDMDPVELLRISKMDLDEIKAEWGTVSHLHGQRQKAYEGLYAARLMRQMDVPVTILFNVVAHSENIGHLDDILATIPECVPGSSANPYPAQSLKNGRPCWTPASLSDLRAHTLKFLEGTMEGKPGITRRLHYYAMLESAFRKWRWRDTERLCEFLSGQGAWDCTARPGAYRYAQIGKYTGVHSGPQTGLPTPGGHLGCFWNPILGLPWQVDQKSVEEVAYTLLYGMYEHGMRLGSAVQKTNIMPRLEFDVVNTELGLPTELLPEYFGVRQEYATY